MTYFTEFVGYFVFCKVNCWSTQNEIKEEISLNSQDYSKFGASLPTLLASAQFINYASFKLMMSFFPIGWQIKGIDPMETKLGKFYGFQSLASPSSILYLTKDGQEIEVEEVMTLSGREFSIDHFFDLATNSKIVELKPNSCLRRIESPRWAGVHYLLGSIKLDPLPINYLRRNFMPDYRLKEVDKFKSWMSKIIPNQEHQDFLFKSSSFGSQNENKMIPLKFSEQRKAFVNSSSHYNKEEDAETSSLTDLIHSFTFQSVTVNLPIFTSHS